jgi:sec-independent protein translocase protein TatA
VSVAVDVLAHSGRLPWEGFIMGGMSIWHWVVVGIIVMLLFGRGKVSELMGDVAKGIKSFKKGLAEDEAPTTASSAPAEPMKTIESPATTVKAEQTKVS